MSTLARRLKTAAVGHARRLRSLIDAVRGVPPEMATLRRILRHWGIRRFRINELLGHTSAVSWLVETADGPRVLRHVTGPADYLDYQVLVMRHLASSTFPYVVPAVISSLAGEAYHTDREDSHWLLYPFIEGAEPPQPPGTRDAAQVGELVGHYHRVIAALDAGPARTRFALPLFEVDRVASSLQDHARWARPRAGNGSFEMLLAEHLDGILNEYRRIPAAAIEDAAHLPDATIYNDWHRYNMVYERGEITGLIDFDSVAAAPRLVDFQNALAFLLLDCDAPDDALVAAFCVGYHSVSRLSPRETSLVVPLLLDRVATRIAKVVDWVRTGTPAHDEVVRLVGLFRWLSDDPVRITRLLVSAAATTSDAE